MTSQPEAPTDYTQFAGFIAKRRNPFTKGDNTLWLAAAQGFDPIGGKYVAICETHHTICNFETKANALGHLRCSDFCEPCQVIADQQQGAK